MFRLGNLVEKYNHNDYYLIVLLNLVLLQVLSTVNQYSAKSVQIPFNVPYDNFVNTYHTVGGT